MLTSKVQVTGWLWRVAIAITQQTTLDVIAFVIFIYLPDPWFYTRSFDCGTLNTSLECFFVQANYITLRALSCQYRVEFGGSYCRIGVYVAVISLVSCNNTKDYLSWEPEKINVKCHSDQELWKHTKGKISCVRCHFVKFDLFSRALIRNCLWCYYR